MGRRAEGESREETPRGRSSVTSTLFRMANLAGWPAVAVCNGFSERGTPTSVTFMGKPYGEATILALAKAYQDAAGWHRRHPRLDA